MADPVTGNQVGALLAEVTALVKEASIAIEMFQNPLASTLDRLNTLKPQFDKMEKYNDKMDRPSEELRPIYVSLVSCQELVRKWKNIRSWQIYDKHKCTKEFQYLDSQLNCHRSELEMIFARWLLPPPVKVMHLVTGAVVGALIAEVTVLVENAICYFNFVQTPLKSILDKLSSLKLQFDKMGTEHNEQMNVPIEELRPIYDLLRTCQDLLLKLMKRLMSIWHISEQHRYLEELQDLDSKLAALCNTIDLANIVATNKAMKDEIKVAMERMRLQQVDGSEPVMVESAAAISYEYDVFLSFRGDDTRESFTSTLFHFLSKVHKVKTFMDVIFKKGSKLEELLKMIEKSRMSIVVFSENFAESEWCLKELAKIFEESDRRGHEVVPVFYKVNPSELRHQDTGKTKVHMEKHHSKYGNDSDTVKSWSNAIKELGNSSGYTYWSGRGKQEIELAEEIAQEILKRLHGCKDGEQARVL